MTELRDKVKALPDSYGVYILKDKKGRVVYVGKANSIRKRLYSHLRTRMGSRFTDIDFVTTSSELSALILEAKLIKQFMPRYNVLLRDDKAYPYIKLTIKDEFPRLLFVRKIEPDGSKYFGPFRGGSARTLLKLLGKMYGLRRCEDSMFKRRKQVCLDYHMKRCTGPCVEKIKKRDYRRLVKEVEMFFDKGVDETVLEMKKKMDAAAEKQDFETAASLRDRIKWLEFASNPRSQVSFRSGKMVPALQELCRMLGLDRLPKRIEAFDISNLGASETVGAMVVFKNGFAFKPHYRKFNINFRPLPNDFASMNEMVYRRYAKSLKDELPVPDLIVIDGGKGQLSSACQALKEAGMPFIPIIGIAKKNEEIFTPHLDHPIIIPKNSPSLLVLQRIRDEVHRFVITFHRQKRSKAFLSK